MRATELVQERSDARTEIENMATILPGSLDEYFVRFTDQDKVGFSARQHFGRTPDVDDPGFDPMALPRPQGRPALWFYPLRTYLKNKDLFASQHPYTWLVRLRPDAWLQHVGREDKTDAPPGRQRVGMLRTDQGVPMAIFFRPAFDVVDRWKSTKVMKEIGDRPSEYEPNRRRRRSLFHSTVDGHWVDVFFDRSPLTNSLQITFTVNQNYEAPAEPTRASGSVIRILSTVLKIIREQLPQYMKSARPPKVTFTAKGATRIDLYKKYFVPVIQNILGDRWQLEIVPGDMTVFVWEPAR